MLAYNNIDQKLHLLCQIPAMVTATFVAEKEDYSHTNLVLDAAAGRISSRWMSNSKGMVFLALNLYNSSYQWIDESLQVIREISITGKTFDQLEREIISTLTAVGFESNELTKPLKYEIEAYSFRSEPFEVLEKVAVGTWIKYRYLANQACLDFLNHINSQAEIRIWPHHFDTGVYKEINDRLAVGFGLAVKDSMVNSPYFYLSGYGLGDEITLESLPKLKFGSWKTGDWNGAILPISELEEIQYHEKIIAVNTFTKSALDWYLHSTIE